MREGYKKTEVGIIPEDWEVKKIGDLFDFKNGLNKEKEYFGKGTKIVNYVDVYRNRYVDDSIIKGLVEVTEKEKENFNTQKGDVFFTRTSETIDEIGMTSVLTEDIKDLVYSGFVLRARPKTNELDLNYKKYCFSDFYTRKEIMRKSSCTTRALTSGTLLKDVSIKIPPLKEQEKIAEILSTVDSQIDDTEKLIEKSKELKKGLMQKLLTKGIGHSEFKKTEVGEIPVSWEVKKFKDVSKINQGLQIAIEYRFKEKLDNRLPYITIQYINDKNNKDNEFYIENANESVICTEDEILMTRTGNTGQVVTNEQGVFHNNFFKIDFDRKVLDKDYLVYYLKSRAIQSLIMRYAGTTTIPDLKHSDFYRIPIVLPSIDEQKIISEILISIDNEIEEYKNKKQKLEELKKGLMQQLLTGKIRVTI